MADESEEAGAANKWLNKLHGSLDVRDEMTQSAIDAFRCGNATERDFQRAFADFMKQCAQVYTSEWQTLEKKRNAIAQEEAAIIKGFKEEMIAFLGQAQPEPLTEIAKKVLQQRQELLTRLKWSIGAIARALMMHLEQGPKVTTGAKDVGDPKREAP